MTTTFKYSQTKDNGTVELELSFSKSGTKLDPKLYQELTELAEKIKKQFNEEKK